MAPAPAPAATAAPTPPVTPPAGPAITGEDLAAAAVTMVNRSKADSEVADAAAEPPVDEPLVVEVHAAGPIDRASARRRWQAVVAEVKKAKPTRASMFAKVEVEVDEDGETLVLEFPADESFAMQQAADPENRELLRAALARVFGAAPAFRFQLGRGPVRPAPEPEPAFEPAPVQRVDVDPELAGESGERAPVPDAFESAAGFSEPVEECGPMTSGDGGLEDVLLNQLGARIVAEHRAVTDGEDEQ
ncbi:MAG: hypothetical protein FDZ75_08170 [Actinobacteria bacterium]|nr:MAG: hypothetical protein FDZ75_08170 [Actinomycetota bacterium]